MGTPEPAKLWCVLLSFSDEPPSSRQSLPALAVNEDGSEIFVGWVEVVGLRFVMGPASFISLIISPPSFMIY